MTKFSTKNKALKAAMVGAVAFTPVLAVGVNVDTASAATTEEAATSLASGYAGLTPDQKTVFNIVLANINQYMGNFIQDDVLFKAELTGEMQGLVAPYNYSTEAQLKTDLINRFNTFASAAQDDLQNEGNTDALLSYIKNVSEDLVTETSNVDRTNLDEFYNDLFYILNDSLNSVPQGVRDILQVPSNAVTIVTEIQSEVNAAFAPTGGGGGTPAPAPVEEDNGEVTTGSATIESNPQAVIDAINSAETVDELVIELAADAETVSIPGTILTALENKNDKAVVVIVAGDATYEIPVGQIDLADFAADLGVASAELELLVTVDEVANPLTGKAEFKVLSDAIDFKLSIVAPDGKSIELKYFNKPVKRSIVASATLNPLTTVGVVVNANGTVVAVPTFVPTTAKSAVLYRNSNSVYTLIENSKTFKDVDKGASWAEEYVEKLASRMVVNGVNEDSFKPSQMINRGEFAAILARGLGLVAEDMTAKDFKDVSLSQGFNKNGEIAAVVDAGLVKGFEDGTFRPYDEITRDQAAIMISRAIDYINSDLVKLDSDKKLSNFKDSKEIGAASRTHVEKVYQAGYLEGFLDDTFRPSAEANRAQMAKILYNFLESIEYIN